MWNNLDGLLWLFIALVPFILLQRWLHREIQAVLLIATRSPGLTQVLFALIFLPGVFLHELSHLLAAKLLRVRTGRFSLIPRPMPGGKLQLGYVETASGGLIKDAIIGAAPLITGGILVAYIAVYKLELQFLWQLFQNGQFELFWRGITILPAIRDFWLWFYLTFTVSSMMMPSAADRHAWPAIGLGVMVLLILAILVGIGPWMLENLAPSVSTFLEGVAMIFGLSALVHAILVLPFFLMHRLLTRLTGMDIG